MTAIARALDLRPLLLLAAVAVAARAVTLGNPILHVDEEFYFAAARMWAQGGAPFVDIWDRKPIGLFALYLPAGALGLPAGVWLYQAMALAAVVFTAWMIRRLARDAGWTPGATLAAIGYILWLNLAEGQGGQSPVFYNAAVIGAAWLIRGDHAAGPARALVAMLLVGLAMQVKYTVVFEGVFFGLWILWRRWRSTGRLVGVATPALGLVAMALAPTMAVGLAYALTGRFEDFWFANFASILLRRGDPIGEQLGNLVQVALILSPLLGMAAVAWRDARREGMTTTRAFLFGWLAAALAGLLAFGTWFDHYALPVMVPAAICAAGAIGRAEVRRWAIGALVVAAVGGQALLASKRAGHGAPAEFAALAAAVGRGPGCLWVQSGTTMLHAATDRCRLSRYVYPSHLGRVRETGAVGVDQAAEVRRILSRRPAVIVMRAPYRGERADLRALVERAVARDYRLTATLPLGRDMMRVFAATTPS